MNNDIFLWASSSLSHEEFENFQNSNKKNFELWKNYTDQGYIKTNRIYKEFYLSSLKDTFSVYIETEVTKDNTVQLELEDSYSYWVDRYIAEKTVS